MEGIIHLISCETGYTEEEVIELVEDMGLDPQRLGMDEIEEIVGCFD